MNALKLLTGYGLQPKSILHIGEQWGQEVPAYKAIGIELVVFVEAIPAFFAKLQKYLKAYPEYHGICAV